MGQEVAIPDWAKAGPSPAFASLNPQDDNLSEGIGQSYPVIGYKGKVWSLRHRGERHNFIRLDDGSPSSYIDVVILGQAKQKSKSFYKKFDPNTSEGDRPICASLDGIKPDADVAQKQCDNCALCPRNEWKTDPVTGRKGRECTDYKRLAVLILPTQTKAILGEPLLEPCFLRVPPASLNSLAVMGDNMAAQGLHFSTYITRIKFDPNEAHPKMIFTPLQGLTEKEAPIILKMRQDPTVGRITGGDISIGGVSTLTAAPSMPALSQQVAPTGGPGIGMVIEGSVLQTQVTVSAPKASAPPATPNGSTSTPILQVGSSVPNKEPGSVDTGFGGVQSAPPVSTNLPSVVAAPAPTPSVSDAGAPEASDDDLDARIANLIKTS